MREVDCIIVGQGIAGSNLAYELLLRGKKIAVFDDSWHAAACLVAAGVINPITGQRLVKSWRSETAHPYAKKFYRELEGVFGAKFFHDRKILQLCKSPEEHALWNKRKSEPAYAEFIGGGSCEGAFENLNDKFGFHFIERSAWVEPPSIMSAYRAFFERRGVLVRGKFDYSALKISPECVCYGDFMADKIIFCDGWAAVKNPYFSWLPYRCAKGEILRLKADVQVPEHIIHRGNWLMECGGEFRVGSTWDREHLDTVATAAARAELFNAAKSIITKNAEFEVVDHSAGIRPCTATTRPHLGVHPKFPRVFSFNGFGSKGYALSPFFAREFCAYLFDGAALDSDADLARHVRKFYR